MLTKHTLTRRLMIIIATIVIIYFVARPYLSRTGELIDKPAPRFSHITLDGERVTLGARRDQVTLLNFWATWCPDCIRELPHLDALKQEFGDRLAVISVSGFKEGEARVRRFLKRRPISYPLVHLPEAEFDALKQAFGSFRSIPHTFAIDHTGVIRYIWPERRSQEELRNAVSALLDELP